MENLNTSYNEIHSYLDGYTYEISTHTELQHILLSVFASKKNVTYNIVRFFPDLTEFNKEELSIYLDELVKELDERMGDMWKIPTL